MYDVIIIGAGPAGLTSALYLLRANKKVLLLEAKNYGGQIINANKIENYPGIESISGFDFANNLFNQVKKLGVEIKYETVLKINEDKKVITNKNEYQSKAIIIATGASNRKLNIPNENKYLSKGVSYCATCDGPFYKNKIVAVVGGGNTALEDALYLSNIAQKVYLIHRREEFRGESKYLEELKKKSNVEFILNSNIISIDGNEYLENITIKDQENNIGGAIEQTENLNQQPQELSQIEADIQTAKNTTSFIKPIEGIISSKYGQRDPSTPTVPKNHTGIDLAVNAGTKIKAATAGEVVLKSSEGDYGNHIKVQIGEVSIIYAHCNSIYVNQGDKIEQGQEIAEVGSTGNSTGPHLHFEIRVSERTIDPQTLVEL